MFVEVSPENARRLRAALVDLGFGPLASSVVELTVPGKIWMLGRRRLRSQNESRKRSVSHPPGSGVVFEFRSRAGAAR